MSNELKEALKVLDLYDHPVLAALLARELDANDIDPDVLATGQEFVDEYGDRYVRGHGWRVRVHPDGHLVVEMAHDVAIYRDESIIRVVRSRIIG